MIGTWTSPFVVAEVGINHNGNIDIALDMIAAAKKAGCDAVKFATFRADEFCAPGDPLYPAFKSTELPPWAWRRLKDECDMRDIVFFSTPQNESDLKLLLDAGVPAIKVGSDDLTNLALIDAYARHRLPLILSSGMADMQDIDAAMFTAAARGAPLMLCVCTSEYPCPPEHANIARVATLKRKFPTIPIGFSDHTVGAMAATVAAALGAVYFEKHFTLDNEAQGPDHAFSANPTQLGTWAWAIHNAVELLGDGKVEPTKAERENRVHWRRASGQQIRGTA